MAIPLEFEIHDLFKELASPDEVIENLLNRWSKNLLSDDEQRATARFLLQNGEYEKFCVQISSLLASKKKLPWAELAYALEFSELKLTNKEKRALTEGVAEQNAYEEVLQILSAINWDPLLEKKNSERLARASQELIQKCEFIKEKAQYFRSQRMHKEEAAAIAELRQMFPNDESLTSDQRSADERWAYDIIAQGATERDLLETLNQKVSELTEDEKKMKEVLVANTLQQLKESPSRVYDLALHLHFMEFHSEAIDVLAASGRPLNESELWLRLELMIKSRRFVEALEETYLLEAKFSEDPDAVFAAIYSRSICLWELNQGPLAVELLKSIIKIRPGYRSAHSLLMAWTGGDF